MKGRSSVLRNVWLLVPFDAPRQRQSQKDSLGIESLSVMCLKLQEFHATSAASHQVEIDFCKLVLKVVVASTPGVPFQGPFHVEFTFVWVRLSRLLLSEWRMAISWSSSGIRDRYHPW